MDLSILIVSYNTQDFLLSSVASILRSKTNFTFEIIIVDNNSSDDSVKSIQSTYPEVKLIVNKYNYGFATAMNQAYRVSAGRFLCSFNPDAEVFEDTIQLALDYMQSHPRVGKVGLATINHGHLAVPVHTFDRYQLPHLFKMLKTTDDHILNSSEPFSVDWIFGTGLVIRRSVLPPNVIYVETSFLFWEEYYLSKYIKSKGYELHILPHARINHHGSVTFKSNPQRIYMARLLSFAHEWLVRKEFYGKFNALVNFSIYVLDNFVLQAGLRLKSLIQPFDQQRNSELLDRKARMKAAFKILFLSGKLIQDVDRQAALYFNDNVSPEYPPVTID